MTSATVTGAPSTNAAAAERHMPMPAIRTPLKADPTVLYYACGGGLGHVTRAAAILRQLRRLGVADLLVMTNAVQPLPLKQEKLPCLHLPHPSSAFSDTVQETLHSCQPRVLVIDAFPAGIAGELTEILPDLTCRKVLVYRHLREVYREELLTTTVGYDLLLCAEEPVVQAAVPQRLCEPVLIRDAEERLPREQARARMGVMDERPIVLGVSSGDAEWQADFFALLAKIWRRRSLDAHLRLASPQSGEHIQDHYPLLELFNGVDLLIGASGYNLFHEARACGVPAIFLPRHKRFDNQQWRARASLVADTPEALETLILNALARPSSRHSVTYTNGAFIAARSIADLLTER